MKQKIIYLFLLIMLIGCSAPKKTDNQEYQYFYFSRTAWLYTQECKEKGQLLHHTTINDKFYTLLCDDPSCLKNYNYDDVILIMKLPKNTGKIKFIY